MIIVNDLRVTMREHRSHLQVAGGQPNDAGLVQLRGDGRRKWQQVREFQKFLILLDAAETRCILAFLLHHDFLRPCIAEDRIIVQVMVIVRAQI